MKGVKSNTIVIDPGDDPEAVWSAILVAVERQGRWLAACDAETHEFQTELDETNRGLLAIYAELEAANRRIADLVAMLSHDIRQPLGIITLCGTLLLQDWDDLDDTERRRDVTRILTAGTGMTQLVEEILTLAQIDAAGLGAHPAPVEVHCAAAEAVANVSGAGADTVVIHDGPECWVRQLAEANDGDIAYADHPHGGGCFTVRLPATPAP